MENYSLTIKSDEKKGVLDDITSIIVAHEVNISYTHLFIEKNNVGTIDLELEHVEDIDSLIADLESLKEVKSVEIHSSQSNIYGKRIIIVGGGAQVSQVHHLLEAQRTLRQRRNALDHQRAGVLAATFVNGQQQGLGQIAAGAEELDLTADVLIRHAAGDAVVVRMAHFAHQVVVLVLDRAGVGRNLGAEVLESLRQLGAPENREVRFGRRTEVVQCLQETE